MPRVYRGIWRKRPSSRYYEERRRVRQGTQCVTAAGDIDVGTWTTHAGGTTDLWQQVDENPADDADYIRSVVNAAAATVKLDLGAIATPYPGGWTLRIRAKVI